MPTYEYQCKLCGEEWEEFLKMKDRNIPIEAPCPVCQKYEIKQKMSKCAVCDPFKMKPRRNTTDFKDTIDRIHNSNPGSKIDLDKYK